MARPDADRRPSPVTVGGFIEDFIGDFLADPSRNHLGTQDGGDQPVRAWQEAVVGYSSGADPLYDFLKTHIGPFHLTPLEAVGLAVEEGRINLGDGSPTLRAEDLTVVSWALSQTTATKASNREQTLYPSEAWARARIYGQMRIQSLHEDLIRALNDQGYAAVAPSFLGAFGQPRSERWGKASSWSERHVAYISGLGTFGLCGGLITPLGKAVRFGSIVVRAHIPATPRSYDDPFAYCLHHAKGTCGVCVKRCPCGSVTTQGRDKEACAHHLIPGTAEFVRTEYGFDGYGCGLCQTGVPCESRIPGR